MTIGTVQVVVLVTITLKRKEGVLSYMFTAPRFMTDYAKYKRKELKRNLFMSNQIKYTWLKRIDDAIKEYEDGYISVDEAMDFIRFGRAVD